MKESGFHLLRSKEIIAILDGDVDFGTLSFVDKNGNEKNIKIAMPYLSGPAICEISSHFGRSATYSWYSGGPSRWQYFDEVMEFCIRENRMSDFLSYLFSKDKFANILKAYRQKIYRLHIKRLYKKFWNRSTVVYILEGMNYALLELYTRFAMWVRTFA